MTLRKRLAALVAAALVPIGALVAFTLAPSQTIAQSFDSSGNTKVTVANLAFGISGSLPTGTNSIGLVGLNTGTNSIGTVGLNTGTNSIGLVGLNAGTNIAGKFGIDQTTQGTTNLVNAKLCDYTTTTTCSNAGAIAAGTQGQNGINVRAIGQVIAGTAGFGYPVTGDQVTGQNYTIPESTSGGVFYTRLTSASATACTAIETNTHGRLVSFYNTSNTAQSATLSVYDEGATPTCAAADLLYTIVLPASSTVIPPVNIPTTAGLAYTLSTALTNPIIVTRN